jgi:hypothetical protein
MSWYDIYYVMQKTEVWYFTVQTEQARSIIGLFDMADLRLWAYAFRTN